MLSQSSGNSKKQNGRTVIYVHAIKNRIVRFPKTKPKTLYERIQRNVTTRISVASMYTNWTAIAGKPYSPTAAQESRDEGVDATLKAA